MTQEHQDILDILEVGVLNAKTAFQIMEELDWGFERTNTKVRSLVKELRRDHGELVGSTSHGFFLIGDRNDLDVTVHHLTSRTTEINRVVEGLEEAWDNRNDN